MAERRARDLKKEASWRRLIRRQARSGLTIRAWCLDQRVNEATLYWWRRELARRDAEQAPSTRQGKQQADLNRRDLRKTTSQPQQVRPVASAAERRDQPVASSAEQCSRDSGSRPVFVPVRLAEEDRETGGSRIEIVLTDGRCVRVTGSVDRQALTDVLTVLEPRTC